MNESVRMFLVLVGVTTLCGLLLYGADDLTRERITMQHLRYIKGPAIRKVLADVDNDPLVDRETVHCDGKEVTLFLGKKEGALIGIALETTSQGYGGPLQVITGFDPASGKCKAVAIAGGSETPGIGTRVTEQEFTCQFNGLALATPASLESTGGSIDGISGATVSSKAVCSAVARAQQLFASVRPTLKGGMQ